MNNPAATPRTDAALKTTDALVVEFARGPERELVEALERAERMRQHILTKVVGRLCEPVTGRSAGWGCGLCGGQGKGPANGTRDLEAIAHEPDCMCAPLAKPKGTPTERND